MIHIKQCIALAVITLAGGVLAAIFFPFWLLISLMAIVIILIGLLLLRD